jgi:hypothetical protein
MNLISRKTRLTLGLGFAAVCMMSRTLPADPPDVATLHSQIDAVQQLIIKDQKGSPDDLELSRAIARLRTLEAYVARKNFDNALNNASQVGAADPSDAVQKALEPLIATLTQARDDAAREAAAEMKKVLDDATAAIKTKTNPADFDSVLTEIGDAVNANRLASGDPQRQAAYLQLEAANRFVTQWQSYLTDQKGGNLQNAANDLRNLTMQEGSFMPIPRSELLQRALKESGQATGPAFLDSKIELHSFDDLPTAIAQLEALQRSGNYSMEMGNLSNALQSLHTAWLSYQDKNYTAALQQLTMNPFFGGVMSGMVRVGVAPAPGDQDSLRKEVSELKNQLMVEIVQGLLNLPDLLAPQPGELASDYLLRLAAAREKAGDWTGLQQVLLVYQQAAATFNASAWLQEDLAGLHAYLVGEKLEGAGQDLDAIRSYRQALATIGKFFPADPPAAKLNELQKKYPDLYQQALQQPITPRGP